MFQLKFHPGRLFTTCKADGGAPPSLGTCTSNSQVPFAWTKTLAPEGLSGRGAVVPELTRVVAPVVPAFQGHLADLLQGLFAVHGQEVLLLDHVRGEGVGYRALNYRD